MMETTSKKSNKIYLIVLTMAIAITAMAIGVPPLIEAMKKAPSIAKCLTEKGVKMYGSDSCEHCQSQKELFSYDFVNITYVNCEFNQQICQEKNIKKYPSWVFASGEVITGLQEPTQLARVAGCL